MLSSGVYRQLAGLLSAIGVVIDRAQAGAPIEEVELRVAAALSALGDLRATIDGAGIPAFGTTARHLGFIEFYHRKGHPDSYAGDIANLRDRDVPGVIRAVEDWSANNLDAGLVEAIQGSWNAQNYESAVRDAFVYLEAVLRVIADIDPATGLSGVQLATAVLGPKSRTGSLPTDGFLGAVTGGEREGAHELVMGALRLFRNATAHRRIEYTAAQADDVVHLVSLCLRLLPAPPSGSAAITP